MNKKKAEKEFQELIKSGEIQMRKDGFGSFQGYDDEAGHVYSSKEEVIESFGLGEETIHKENSPKNFGGVF